ncbi:MAG: TIGR03986 family CRISPR-associated RAMP protein [Candidatus Cloacimonas sp.]
MEKGKINKRTTKKNIICLELEKNDGKIVTISERYIRNHEVWKTLADGVYDVEYELMNGKPVKIKIGSTLIDLTQTQQPNKNPNYHQAHSNPDNENSVDTATAPYNFIPLNDVIFTTEPKCIPPFNQYKNNNGYIDLDITALSPIYIRKTLTEEEEKKLVELENSNNLAELADFKLSLSGFYKPADAEFRIPGSSLRGMIRTLYEVVTYSKMTFIDDHHLFYRSFADSSIDLRDLYSKAIIQQIKGAYATKVKAGYLRKDGNKYSIYLADSFHRVEEDLVITNGIINERMKVAKGKSPNSDYKKLIARNPFLKVFFKADQESIHQHSVKMYYSKVTDIQPDTVTKKEDYNEGYLVLSGWVPSQNIGKHLHWVIGEPSNKNYEIPDKVIDSYRKDKNRNSVDLLQKAENKDCPCFFILEDNQVKAFGHTGFFRMVYQHSIGELRPEKHKSKELDMAEAVFGYIKDNDILPGRVYFEDAICDTPDKILKEQNPKILSSPKPTSFQYYIQQYPKIGNLEKNKINRLKNYDSPNACLAGFKFYWHRDSNDWTANPDDVRKNKTQYTKIQPLDKNSHFKGRIRFTNLSDTELGALLFILNLPEGCAHKIGMAKPLGLGSIRIDAKLNLIDRQKRYTNLKDEGIKEIEDFSPYLQAYYQLLNDNLNIQINDPWTDIERLKQLKCMLDFDHKPSSEKTRYLEIEHLTPNGVKENEYKLRRILQKPCQLVNS